MQEIKKYNFKEYIFNFILIYSVYSLNFIE